MPLNLKRISHNQNTTLFHNVVTLFCRSRNRRSFVHGVACSYGEEVRDSIPIDTASSVANNFIETECKAFLVTDVLFIFL